MNIETEVMRAAFAEVGYTPTAKQIGAFAEADEAPPPDVALRGANLGMAAAGKAQFETLRDFIADQTFRFGFATRDKVRAWLTKHGEHDLVAELDDPDDPLYERGYEMWADGGYQ